jgi:uncharacterized phage protein (TIGR02218 family)
MPRITSLFSTAERSGGSPVECYTIQRGTRMWRYTSADASQTIGGLTFLPANVSRGDLSQKKDTPGVQITVTLNLATDAAQALMVETSERISVTIQKLQSAGDPIKPVLLGQVISLKFADDALELTVATVEYHSKTLIPRVLVQRTCPHALYGYSCGVDKDDFAVETTVASISGQVISVVASASGNAWRNGMLRLSTGRILFIADHTTSAITVWGKIPDDLTVSDDVTVYRGCDKLFATCETVFDNAKNFGGFPNLPNRNPMLGSLR